MTSINFLPADMLLKIIQTITIEKDNEIAKLKTQFTEQKELCYEYSEALDRAGVWCIHCEECKKVFIDLDDEQFSNRWECEDEIICGHCMEEIEDNVDRQNEIMASKTEYVVSGILGNRISSGIECSYDTYEEIPMCYKTSNMLIKKIYYNNWNLLINNEECKIVEILNGNINYHINHKLMIQELREIININDIYLQSVLEVHRPPISQRLPYICGSYYDTDRWYRTVPIKTLLNVDWCSPEKCIVDNGFIGRSWYKKEGYGSPCACAYKSLTEKYKKKYTLNVSGFRGY
tara:strand:+ start:187 stop:1056 length:870 start_codon:yes stop_codon:yes gene_type:complete